MTDISAVGSIHSLLEQIKRGEKLPIDTYLSICAIASVYFAREPAVLSLQQPIMIAGDIHGQFADMMSMFDTTGEPGDGHRYLFLGDLVDRGPDSLRVSAYLFCLKILYPDQVFIIRGNHETAAVSRTYGFYREVMVRYGNPQPWSRTMAVFEYLPVSAVVGGRYFCVHGGLSPHIPTIDAIHRLPRSSEAEAVADLLWSDPADGVVWAVSRRGSGRLFGEAPTVAYLRANNLSMVVRAHETQPEGYSELWGGLLATVWSAPNYTGRTNKACVMAIDGAGQRSYIEFQPATINR